MKINDLDLKNWREYLGDISTDSLWISEKKEKDGKFIIPKRSFLPKSFADGAVETKLRSQTGFKFNAF